MSAPLDDAARRDAFLSEPRLAIPMSNTPGALCTLTLSPERIRAGR